MLHRIFTAISLPENVKKQLLAFSKEHYQLPAKWVNRENLHITLNFLGKLDDNQLLETIEAVKSVVPPLSAFSIRLDRISYGPDEKFPPRLVWVSLEKNKELYQLQKDLEDTIFNLPSYKYKIKEKQKFSPHITLARIKAFEFRKLSQNIEINQPLNIGFEVKAVQVIESELKKEGPQYTILENLSLA